MKITKTSILSNKTNTLDIQVSQDQITSWQNGELIQNAMPGLSADDREFLMTGITPDEWEDNFEGRLNEYPNSLISAAYISWTISRVSLV